MTQITNNLLVDFTADYLETQLKLIRKARIEKIAGVSK